MSEAMFNEGAAMIFGGSGGVGGALPVTGVRVSVGACPPPPLPGRPQRSAG